LKNQEPKILVKQIYKWLLIESKAYKDPNELKLFRKTFSDYLQYNNALERDEFLKKIRYPKEIATIVLCEIGLGTVSLSAIMLYDLIKDGHIKPEDVYTAYDSKVGILVEGLIKVSGIQSHQVIQQTEKFMKLLLSVSNDIRVTLIKLAERLLRIRQISENNKVDNNELEEIYFLYSPIAHRLGLYTIKQEIEDLYIKCKKPIIYKEINQKVKHILSQRKSFIDAFIDPLDEELKKQRFSYVIKRRTKSIHSIIRKMEQKNVGFDEIYDLFAIRIVIDDDEKEETTDCWQVYSIVSNLYEPNSSRLRDWITVPKFNGYESLHTTVLGPGNNWVEVQIRSKRMDEIAEKGLAAHWKYKGGKSEREF